MPAPKNKLCSYLSHSSDLDEVILQTVVFDGTNYTLLWTLLFVVAKPEMYFVEAYYTQQRLFKYFLVNLFSSQQYVVGQAPWF